MIPRTLLTTLRLTVLVAALIALVAARPPAQTGTPIVRNFTAADLGKHSGVFDVDQAGDGVIYAVSPNTQTILSFDGKRWRNLQIDAAPVELIRDDTGRLWVGTDDGIGYLVREQFQQPRFVRVDVPFAPSDPRRFASARRTADGVIFQNARLRVACSTDGAVALWRSQDNERIIGSNGETVYVTDVDTHVLTEVRGETRRDLTPADSRPISSATPLGEDRLVLWRGDTFEVLENGATRLFSAALQERLTNAESYFFKPLLDGVAVGTSRGMIFCSKTGEVLYELDSRNGLPTATTSRITPDRDGSLWLARSNGIACVFHSRPVRAMSPLLDTVNEVFDVQRDGDRLVFASDTGLHFLDARARAPGGMVESVPNFANAHLRRSGDALYALGGPGLAEIRDGSMTLVAADSELSAAHFVAGTPFVLLADVNTFVTVYRIEAGQRERIGTTRLGYYAHGLLRRGNEIWVDGNGGNVACLHFAAGWDAPPDVHKMTEDQGRAWLDEFAGELTAISEGGFSRPSAAAGAITFEPDPRFAHLEFVPGQLYWSGPDNSLLRAAGSTCSMHVLGDDGAFTAEPARIWHLPGEIGLRKPFYDAKLDQLIVSATAGLFACDLRRGDPLAVPGINVFVTAKSKEGPIALTSTATLPPDAHLVFEAAVPDYSPGAQIEYKVRLRGFEDWPLWGELTQLEYSLLEPGDYACEVLARRPDGPALALATPAFVIGAPWFRTWWAYALYGLIAVLIVGAAVSLRSRQLVATQALLADRVARQTSELAKVNERLTLEVQATRDAQQRQRDLQARLNESERLESLGRLAGGIAHDFNNLLTVITTNAEFLQDTHRDNEYADQILRSARVAADLCKQMLVFSGSGSLNTRPHDLNEIVDEVGKLLHTTVSPNRLVLELDRSIPTASVDRSQVQQVLLNLVANAAEAVRDGGSTVRVRTGHGELTPAQVEQCHSIEGRPQVGAHVWIDVIDDGPGLDEATQRRMFDPFFSTKAVGRGLGLATVLRIVSRHDGAVLVDPEPERGTRIRVLLPAYAESTTERPEAATTPVTARAAGDGRRILVVDDDDAVRASFARLLQSMGATVVSEGTAARALQRCREPEPFDLAFIDIAMPEMDGAELAQHVRSLHHELPIVMISGFSNALELPALLTDRGVRFLAKPFRREQLRGILMETFAG